jgi:hypothetical protein
LPLNAKFRCLVDADFGNQAFNEHLSPAGIQLVDDGAQLAVLRFGRRNDQRIGRGVGLNLPTGGAARRSGACTRRAGSHGRGACRC